MMSPVENSFEKVVTALQTIKKLTRPESGAWLIAHETLTLIAAEQNNRSLDAAFSPVSSGGNLERIN
ncbi:MAG: hypothetical protein SFW36_14260 [Leptolyngbyaceae cyanobacterium bins.59]|nr:hypothetical protein [Leptolyngbyaceae cyanobacterium bins.59]